MTPDSAHRSRWEVAEVVFGIPFVLSLPAQILFPPAVPGGFLRQGLFFVGIALMILGVGIVILARRELARYAQPRDPGYPTTRIVKTGVFALSRNPLYLGAAFTLAGLALTLTLPWTLAALLVSLILCHRFLIVPEEEYLRRKFGREYGEYLGEVRRWLGRKQTGNQRGGTDR